MAEVKQRKNFFQRFLDFIEWSGNKLPHPFTLFIGLAVLTLILSAVLSIFDVSVVHPGDSSEIVEVKNLLSAEGIEYIFLSMTDNFIGFAPLGVVLITMLGIGIAERTGLIAAALRAFIFSIPKSLITAGLVFAGVMSSVASDAGYVVLPPLGAVIFLTLGRHPLAGIAAAFAGVSGGFSANLLLSGTDAMLSEITMEAAAVISPEYVETMNVAMNYYFIIVSVFLLTLVGWFVTEKIVEPRLGAYDGKFSVNVDDEMAPLSKLEKKGLISALISIIVSGILVALLVVFPWSPLRGDEGTYLNTIIQSPFMQSLVPIIAILFFIPGFVYGRVTKEIKSDKDVANHLAETMATMGTFIVLAFAAGQFIAFFAESNIGLVIGVYGAELLETLNLKGIPLIIGFILVTAVINLFIGSASAKWAMMAPIFVPILMQLGYSPELTTMAYRIADSSTNIITPLMTYFAIIIAFSQKYVKDLGIGTLVSVMLPYSLFFLVMWSLMLIVWMMLGLPLGPNAPIVYP